MIVRRTTALSVLTVAALAGTLLTASPAQAKPSVTKAPVAVGRGGAASTVDIDATRVAIDVLRHGGNAVDAAVAAAATLGVTEPFSAGIGGGGFFVFYDARTGKVHTIDGREAAPASMNENAFVNPATGLPYAFQEARVSGISVGVPGTPPTWQTALRKWGTISLRDALRPAIQVADRGFAVDPTFRGQINDNAAAFGQFSSTSALYLPGGAPPAVGSTFRNPDLAQTYRLIGRQGTGAFYRGELAADIVARCSTRRSSRHRRHRGRSRSAPARWKPPTWPATTSVRRGRPTCATAASTCTACRPRPAADRRSARPSTSWRTGISATCRGPRRCTATSRRARSPSPTATATSATTPRARCSTSCSARGSPASGPARSTRPRRWPSRSPRASPTAAYGRCAVAAPASVQTNERGTTNLTVADRWGNVVEYTLTIEQIGGNAMVVPGRGFLLNNELTDFNFTPTQGTAPDPNLPAPGKRPRSSMAPTIVLSHGKPFLAVGSPGGSTIITTVLQILVNRIDLGMTLPEAIAAPRATQRNTAAVLAEPAFLASPEAAELTALGHTFSTMAEIGAATGVEFLPDGQVLAAAEPVRRGGGSAAVVKPSQ